MKSNDLTNLKIGKLLVVKKAYSKSHKIYWECKCDCGKTVFVHTSNLTCNRTKSCGCLKLDGLIKRSTTHNQRHTKLYEIWKSMKQRCFNPKCNSYHNYGGRGITIYEEWKNDFSSFYNWAINNGYKEGLTIDRIDNNGDYKPNNCRWVNRLVQGNNTRANQYITINNETKTIADWCRTFNIKYSTFHSRYKRYGWDIIKALKTPAITHKASK